MGKLDNKSNRDKSTKEKAELVKDRVTIKSLGPGKKHLVKRLRDLEVRTALIEEFIKSLQPEEKKDGQ